MINVQELQQSYGRCSMSKTFFDDFYELFMDSSPIIKNMFKDTDMDRQKDLLRHSLTYLLMFASGSHSAKIMIDKVAETHSSTQMDIQPWMYMNWVTAFMTCVKKHDKKATDAILSDWKECLEIGVNHILKAY